MKNKPKTKRTFVLVHITAEGFPFCFGIYGDYYTAYGHIMAAIDDRRDSFKGDGDVFKVGELFETECDGGVEIDVTFQAACWDEACEERYIILFYDDCEPEGDNGKYDD